MREEFCVGGWRHRRIFRGLGSRKDAREGFEREVVSEATLCTQDTPCACSVCEFSCLGTLNHEDNQGYRHERQIILG